MKDRRIIILAFISLDGVMQAPGAPEEDRSGGFKYGGWTVPYFDDELDEIRALKKQHGPDLQVHGSVGLIQTLMKNGLADELWLKTFPVILGGGKRLFGAGTNPGALRLKESKCTSRGGVITTYEVAGEVKTGSFGP